MSIDPGRCTVFPTLPPLEALQLLVILKLIWQKIRNGRYFIDPSLVSYVLAECSVRFALSRPQ